MKKLVLIMLAAASMPAFAQKIASGKVPEDVKNAFQKKYAGIKEVSWEKEKGNYEANFKENGGNESATFDAAGNWLESERKIAVTSLPKTVKEYVAKNCKGASVHEASIINKANGDANYEANVLKTDYIFDAQGNFLKTQKD